MSEETQEKTQEQIQAEAKSAALALRNSEATEASRMAYYLNKDRDAVDYEAWDANEMSWIWQQFYNAEKVIAQLQKDLLTGTPKETAQTLQNWLKYPTHLLLLQMRACTEAIKGAREIFSKPYEEIKRDDLAEYKAKMHKAVFATEKPAVSTLKAAETIPGFESFRMLKGRNGVMCRDFTTFYNSQAKWIKSDCEYQNAKSVTLKRGSTDLNAFATIEKEFARLEKNIYPLKMMYYNFGSKAESKAAHADMEFELWQSAITLVEDSKHEFEVSKNVESYFAGCEARVKELEKLKLKYEDGNEEKQRFDSEISRYQPFEEGLIYSGGAAHENNRWVTNFAERKARLERLFAEYNKIIAAGSYRAYLNSLVPDAAPVTPTPSAPDAAPVTPTPSAPDAAPVEGQSSQTEQTEGE